MAGLLLVLAVILFTSFSITKAENNRTFPTNFLFGVVTSAYQTEGAWNEDGKGENIWDDWIHSNPSHIKDNANADVASDSYHHYEEDIGDACVYVGAYHYRFSISWSRVLPQGFNNEINLDGLSYYQRVINKIRAYGMVPVATLYHHDLPKPLQDIGGWTNPDMVNYFASYARVVFEHLYNVKYWITFDDPRSTCRLGYGEGVYAPGIAEDGIAEYLCAYVLIKSHAAVYHMYKEEFTNSTVPAKMSIAIDLPWSEPLSNYSAGHVQAAERRNMFEFGLYANPIFKGNWPQVVIDRVGFRSQKEKLTKSRLPEFTKEEIDYINGTFDFMATNIYTTHIVADIIEPEYDDPGYMKDMRVQISVDPEWTIAQNGNPVCITLLYYNKKKQMYGRNNLDTKL
ncbi:hypothetical protein NQ314_012258 [Rhamnusium bicolor]|uniref:Myrosinase 1-like n=1 Tax=Rhamnusium bicolor TaxID=1586634 RepID=A0AAV8XDH4_9CUCU|nr:hypothetical protein NQ314_012258 [Rhamnusium bicolor]